MPEAIVFFSKGLPAYAYCSLFQAHFSNPEIPIHFISDVNPGLSFVNWENVSRYEAHWKEFETVYHHLNSCEEWLTRVWFYRWFAIKHWMESRSLNSILHLDTDILLYCSLRSLPLVIPRNCIGLGSSVNGPFSGHCAFIHGSRVLSDFTAFCRDIYEKPVMLKELKDFYDMKKKKGEEGGVCDMYALGLAWGLCACTKPYFLAFF